MAMKSGLYYLFSVNNTSFILVHTASLLLPSLMHMYAIYTAMLMFIPMMGRAGDFTIPDLFIGVIAAAGVVVPFSFHVRAAFLIILDFRLSFHSFYVIRTHTVQPYLGSSNSSCE